MIDEIQLGLNNIMQQRFVMSPVAATQGTALSQKGSGGKEQQQRNSIRSNGKRSGLKRRLSNLKLGRHLSLNKYSSL